MKKLVSLMAGAGDWLVSLSDRARMQLVLACLVLLIGGGIYKLINSIDRLNDPLPVATPEQLLKPMEKLFERTKANVNQYQQSRQHEMSRVDSLAKAYSSKADLPQ